MKTKFQHYIPRFYLENFTDKNGRVWVYDKKLKRSYATNPTNIAGETYFYDVPKLEERLGIPQFVEKFLQPFESDAAIIITSWLAKLKDKTCFYICDDEREAFSIFLITLLIRTPNHRKLVMQMGALLKKMELMEHLRSHAPEVAEKPFEIQWNKEHEPYYHARTIVDVKHITEGASILHRHIWIVARNSTSNSLYTSDCPIVTKRHKEGGWRSYSGIAAEGIQVMFPFSPNHTLYLLERNYWKNFAKLDGTLAPFELANETLMHDNSGQVLNSSRFVYCDSDDFDFARRVCEDWPDITDPQRQIVRMS